MTQRQKTERKARLAPTAAQQQPPHAPWRRLMAEALARRTGVLALSRALAALAPRLPRLRPPRSARDPELEAVAFPSLDGVPLFGWLLRPRESFLVPGASRLAKADAHGLPPPRRRYPRPRGVGILCHGFLHDHLEVLPVARLLRDAGYAALLFDFRATGHSGGDCSTLGYREALDVRGALRFLETRPEFAGLPRFGYGTSMGAAALTLAAPEEPQLRALILDCLYPHLDQALLRRAELLWGPLAPFAASTARSALQQALGVDPAAVAPAAILRQLTDLPTLLIFGEWDLFIPRSVARELAAIIPEPKEVWHAPRTPHSSAHLCRRREFEQRVLAFLERWLPPPSV